MNALLIEAAKLRGVDDWFERRKKLNNFIVLWRCHDWRDVLALYGEAGIYHPGMSQ